MVEFPILVRPAEPADAPAAAALLRRSIAELCSADHYHDPETLDRWLENKTTERFLFWLSREDAVTLVALEGEEIVGVGGFGYDGEVRLCYVLPGRERRGVGSALLRACEALARARNLPRLVLKSTITARGFYARRGYISAGEPTPGFGLTLCHPFEKILGP